MRGNISAGVGWYCHTLSQNSLCVQLAYKSIPTHFLPETGLVSSRTQRNASERNLLCAGMQTWQEKPPVRRRNLRCAGM